MGDDDARMSTGNAEDASVSTVEVHQVKQDVVVVHEDDRTSGHKRCCAVVDGVISSALVAPLVVGAWRGLWDVMDMHRVIFPDVPAAVCGLALHATFALLRDTFERRQSAKVRSVCEAVVKRACSRLYCWLFLASCVSHWRGAWAIWPGVAVEGMRSVVRLAVCLVALILLRATRNLIQVPFYVQLDSPKGSYFFPTRFRKSSKEPLLYVLDCLFSVVVVGSLVVFVWRGAWDLLDVYLYPQDKAWSSWASFGIGYGLAIVTFLLQGVARRACARLKGASRLIVADLFLLLSFVATINVWRSIWTLLDIYLLPSNPELSNWLTHGGCFLLLMLLNCGNSVLVRGVYIDAEEEGGQCVVFPCYYLRLFFQRERVKKRRLLLEMMAAEKMADVGDTPLLVKGGPSPIIVKEQQQQQQQQQQPSNHVVVHVNGNG